MIVLLFVFIVIVIILHPPIAIRIGLRKSGLASVIEFREGRRLPRACRGFALRFRGGGCLSDGPHLVVPAAIVLLLFFFAIGSQPFIVGIIASSRSSSSAVGIEPRTSSSFARRLDRFATRPSCTASQILRHAKEEILARDTMPPVAVREEEMGLN